MDVLRGFMYWVQTSAWYLLGGFYQEKINSIVGRFVLSEMFSASEVELSAAL